MGNPVDVDRRKRASEDCALFQQLQYLSREDFVRTSMDRSNQALYQDPCWFGLGRTKSSLQRARIDSDADQESTEQQIRHRHEHCGHRESHPAKVTSRFPQNHSQYPDFLQESDHNHSIATAYEYRAPQDSFQRAKNHKKRFPSFDGCLEEEEFLEWLQEVEDFFLFYGVSEETKVAHVVRRLKDKAFSWWDQIQLDRIRIGKFPIFTWKRMKRYLCRKFVPAYFEQLMFEQNPRNHQNPNFLPTIESQIFPLRSSHKHSSFTSQQSTKFCYPRQDTQFSLLTNSGVNIGCQEKFREVAQETNVEYHNQVGDYKFVQLEDIMSSNFRGNEDDLVEDQPFLNKNIMEAYSHENDKIAARELSICLESGLDIAAEDGLAARECQEKVTTSSCLLDLVIPDLKDEPLVQKTPKLPANMSQYSTHDEAKENLLERKVLESENRKWELLETAGLQQGTCAQNCIQTFKSYPTVKADEKVYMRPDLFFLWKRRKKEAFVFLHHMEFKKKFFDWVYHKFREKNLRTSSFCREREEKQVVEIKLGKKSRSEIAEIIQEEC